MTADQLSIVGTGLALQPSALVVDRMAARGVDASKYKGWTRHCVAPDSEHPSTMGSAALDRALAAAGCAPEELRLLLSIGLSREYLPNWSVAAEVMRLSKVPHGCLGFDILVGCLGTLTGLEIARGWLRGLGGGYAAIVGAERWTHTVPPDPKVEGMWGFSDGAGACIVALGPHERTMCTYVDAVFSSHTSLNGFILIKYGGTVNPQPPPEEAHAYLRHIDVSKGLTMFTTYVQEYTRVLNALLDRHRVRPDWIVCNQISPTLLAKLAEIAKVEPARVYSTGHELGHLGSADIILGLQRLAEAQQLHGNIVLVASTAYGFGAALVTAP